MLWSQNQIILRLERPGVSLISSTQFQAWCINQASFNLADSTYLCILEFVLQPYIIVNLCWGPTEILTITSGNWLTWYLSVGQTNKADFQWGLCNMKHPHTFYQSYFLNFSFTTSGTAIFKFSFMLIFQESGSMYFLLWYESVVIFLIYFNRKKNNALIVLKSFNMS